MILDGKVAIVTGAARGIGAGIARALAAEGACVALLDVRRRQVEETAAVIGERALGLVCDITDTVAVEAAVATTVERFGTVDILVNNAIAGAVGVPFEEIDDDQLELAMQTGPMATVKLMRACFPHLKGGGRVINLRSGSEVQGLQEFGSYVAAKAAVGGLTRVAAREWGPHGITVNSIAPFVLSPGAQAFFDETPGEEERFLDRMPLRHFGDAEADIGRVAVFLAGPDASYVTGCTINANGGINFFS